MTSITKTLSDIVGGAFEAQGLPAALGAVRVSDRPDLCQFQCNGAMAAAKQARKNPREVAEAVADYLRNTPVRVLGQADIFSKIDIAGPGFINIDVNPSFAGAFLTQNAGQDKLGVEESGAGRTAVLDYGGPNIAKAMHVGHLRSSIIGDSLRRIMGYAGYRTIGDVHMGDWGTPMGMILSELEIRGDDHPITMEYLAEIYPQAAQACKEDEARMAQAREATRKLQDGDPAYTKKWREFIDVSIAGMKANFEALNVHFDEWKGESDAHPFIAPMVETLKAGGWAVESDGALVVPVGLNDDTKEVPPLILLKSDGAVLYGTTDLATLVERMAAYAPDKVVYIVDQRQSLHFEQVFRAARKGGIVPEGVELTHAGFGTMNGPDGKPFKTRAGGVMKLEDLIQMGVDKATQRLNEAEIATEFSADERAGIARMVAVAALKFADLQNNRVADYVFDIDRMTSFEGKTGPYLLYQAVRIKSLLRKAQEQGVQAGEIVLGAEDAGLALLLCEFPDHFEGALTHYAPHILCEYVYRLAQAFSSFYGQCHILSEPDAAVRGSRLRLCELTCRVLETALDLLGIRIPERM